MPPIAISASPNTIGGTIAGWRDATSTLSSTKPPMMLSRAMPTRVPGRVCLTTSSRGGRRGRRHGRRRGGDGSATRSVAGRRHGRRRAPTAARRPAPAGCAPPRGRRPAGRRPAPLQEPRLRVDLQPRSSTNARSAARGCGSVSRSVVADDVAEVRRCRGRACDRPSARRGRGRARPRSPCSSASSSRASSVVSTTSTALR